MDKKSVKTILISAAIFAFLWPVLMGLGGAKTLSLATWFIGLGVFFVISVAGYMWRKSRQSKSKGE